MRGVHASNGIMLALVAALTAAALAASPHSPARSAAEQQYQRAQTLEAALETQPKVSRTEADYERAIESYRRVLLITPQAQFATPSMVAIGRLYEEMGRLIDPGYFQKAIDAYQLLLREYPRTRHGPEALYAIARIEQGPLGDAAAANKYLRELIERYPSSDQADLARLNLAGAAQARQEERKTGTTESAEGGQRRGAVPAPALSEPEPEPAEGGQESKHPARILGIRSVELAGHTRILIALDGPVKFRSARVAEPERVYFDLSRAYLATGTGDRLTLARKFVTSVHIAQNRPYVVRVVLDISRNAGYTASLLRHPYRLAIDVGTGPSGRAAADAEGTRSSHSAGSGETGAAAGTDTSSSPEHLPDALPDGSRRYENRQPPAPSGATVSDTGPSPANPADLLPDGSRRYEYARPGPAVPARPTRSGTTSLTRELGLKIGRIVIDAGHGGFDTGTIGPTGLEEKDVCLDVAKRLGRLIQRRLPGASVVYTRDDDSFVPLETRTEIANEKQADLFISIHANSSSDPEARGIETYYLNFTTSPGAMAVAARENALSQESVHQLQDLLKKISLNDKILESRELAADVDRSLERQLRLAHVNERDRGVKKAPFVVLIGAHMPSILAEISFLSNPTDERLLKIPRYRQRIAEGLFNGIEGYLASLNSLSYNDSKAAAASQK